MFIYFRHLVDPLSLMAIYFHSPKMVKVPETSQYNIIINAVTTYAGGASQLLTSKQNSFHLFV